MFWPVSAGTASIWVIRTISRDSHCCRHGCDSLYTRKAGHNENGEKHVDDLALTEVTEKALHLRDSRPHSIIKGAAKSGAEFFASRSYHGLDMHTHNSLPGQFIVGRTGRASRYGDEKNSENDL